MNQLNEIGREASVEIEAGAEVNPLKVKN